MKTTMQKLLAASLLGICMFVLVGCSGGSTPPAGQSLSNDHAVEEAGSVLHVTDKDSKSMEGVKKQLDELLVPGSAYADARERLLANGWKPVVTPDCKEQVIGGDWQKICATEDAPAVCKVCEQMPELSAYSGDGNVLAKFVNSAGLSIEVNAYGMLEDWNVRGEDSHLQYAGWEFEKK
ncbi:MAG: hypothetical protein Q4G62_00405 [Pseudomonadota bacterium]|nr:hypothetical protein [Pseudomonadota bacterium]